MIYLLFGVIRFAGRRSRRGVEARGARRDAKQQGVEGEGGRLVHG